jgi:ubiquinone biosynthesis protein
VTDLLATVALSPPGPLAASGPVVVVVVAAWVLLGPLAVAVTTVVGGRLLGVRRGWLSLAVAGVTGWGLGVLLSGILSRWDWSSIEMVLAALTIGAVLTMTAAVTLDFLATPGSLARGEQAGLVTIPHPLRSARSRVAPLARYRELMSLAAANGLLHRPGREAGRVRLEGSEVAIRRTLEQAGGVFVKLGQVASTRPDLLPPALCDELGHLRTGAAPAPADAIRPVLEAELGRPVEEAFARFEWEPLASASIAQVYAAELHSGEAVVVKVQRPRLDELVARDAAALRQIAGALERRTPLGLAARPRALAEEFLDNLADELDFRVEAANSLDLAAATPAELGVHIPAVHAELSTARLLVEERFDGVPMGQLDGALPAPERRAVADRLLQAFILQLLSAGIFHADPHPGNILVLADGTLAMIDLGAVGRLDSVEREAVTHMMIGMATRDVATLREALLSVSTIDDNLSVRAVDAALARFLTRNIRTGASIGAAAFADLIVLIGALGLQLPRWVATLGRAMVTLEGTLRSVDPTYSLIDAALRLAPSLPGPPADLAELRTVALKELALQLPRMRRLPERVDALLDQAAAGRLGVRVSLFASERDEQLTTRLVNRLVAGVLATGIGIGSTLLLGVDGGPAVTRSVTLPELIGYCGLLAASVLTLRVVAAIIRDGLL